MSEARSPKSRIVTALIAGSFLAATAVATGVVYLIWWLCGWGPSGWGLDLTLRIVWACGIVGLASAMLTRLTIIGWYFRRYFRPHEKPPPDPVSGGPRRPARAPWYKSGALSFSMTVTLVSLTGATAIASAVIWIMGDVFGDWLMWLVLKIIWGVYWVTAIAIVLTRIGVFRLHMLKARAKPPDAPGAEPPQQPSEQRPAEPPQRPTDQLSLE